MREQLLRVERLHDIHGAKHLDECGLARVGRLLNDRSVRDTVDAPQHTWLDALDGRGAGARVHERELAEESPDLRGDRHVAALL